MRRRLQRIPELYVAVQVETVEGTPRPEVRSAGGFRSQLPLSADSLDILIVTSGRQMPLVGFALLVAEEQRLRWPVGQPASAYGWLLDSCALLVRQWYWIVGREWAGELAREAREVEHLLRSVIEPQERWDKTRMPCPVCRKAEPVRDSTLWRDRLDPGAPVIVCRDAECGTQWESDAWEVLAAELDVPVTVRDVLTWASWLKEDTLRKWVKRGIVPNHGKPNAPRVILADVLLAWQRHGVSSGQDVVG